jgi:hypothetical protein
MTRTSCLSTISCAALLLAITGYGCGGASDSLPGAGTGGKTGNPGSGGSISGGTGGIFGGGTGGIFGGGSGGESGSGGTVGGSGGSSGRPDAAADGFQRPDGRADGFQRPDGQQRPDAVARDVVARDVVARDVVARDLFTRDLFTRPEVAAADGGIPMCVANARCTVGNPPATCMEPCMIGTAAGERACACVRPGIVACGQCRRAADGGAADSAGQ